MKIDFETPDSLSQLEMLRDLLRIQKPTRNDIALALVLIIRIFYENRPGKLRGYLDESGYHISGTGCHNPTSYKNEKSLMGIGRLELEISKGKDFFFDLSYENMRNGFLTANIFSRQGWGWSVIADIGYDDKKGELVPGSVIITGGYIDCLMEELRHWLSPLLHQLASLHSAVEGTAFFHLLRHPVVSTGEQYSPSKDEKVLVLSVQRRLPKRYSGYFFPDQKAEDIAYCDELFEQFAEVDRQLSGNHKECEKKQRELLQPLMVRLKASIPVHLRKRITDYFSFTESEKDPEKYDLPKLFLKERESSIGIFVLVQFPLSHDEVTQLNVSWNSFVYIHPKFNFFRIYKPKTFLEKQQRKLNMLLEVSRNLNR